MKKTQFQFEAKGNPIVELDSQSMAAYVRFSKEKVAKTLLVSDDGVIVTVDCDSNDQVIGVELVGVSNFTISKLGELGGFNVPKAVAERTQYVPSLVPA